MAKSSALAAPAAANLPALPEGMGASDRFSGMDSKDLVLPVAHLFQGLPTERTQYGKHEPGEIIHSLTLEPVASNLFVPIMAYKEWVKWREPRGAGLEYAHRDIRQVPAEDLERYGDNPPAATEYHNWVVLFQGEDAPCVIRCKSTALKASKTLFTLENIRQKRGPGLYEFGHKERSNDKGTWFVPDFKAKGDPSPEMFTAVVDLFHSLRGQTITSNEAVGEAQGEVFDPDAD